MRVGGRGDLHLGHQVAPALAADHDDRPPHPAPQGRGSGDARELVLGILQAARGGQVRVAGAVDLGGAEKHDVDAPPARVIEEIGNGDLAGAPLEVAEVLGGGGAERRDPRVQRADAGQIGHARRVRATCHLDGQNRQG